MPASERVRKYAPLWLASFGAILAWLVMAEWMTKSRWSTVLAATVLASAVVVAEVVTDRVENMEPIGPMGIPIPPPPRR